jgi:hypothetical protein
MLKKITVNEEMYISFDIYHDRKENKNVGTFVFVQLYIISRHCWYHFKSHDFSFKVHSCHKHKCCPTSDESLPRISPIRGTCLVMPVTKRDRWESTSQRASNV